VGERLTLEQIRQYWTDQAKTHGSAPAASWSDVGAIDLEIREITKRLDDGDRVLDVGCANGYSTVQFAARKQITIRGVDYVPAMIDEARARVATLADRLRGTADFAVGDVMQLAEADAAYDKVVCVRVVINLGDWSRQRAAVLGLGRMLKAGGLLLLSEATLQGWQRLNAFREEWGLAPIPVPPFNTYLDERQLVDAVAPVFDLVEIANFASTYYVGTRVLKPLLAAAMRTADPARSIDAADPTMLWNEWCAQLPPWGDYGTQKLFVFRKR
jgi:SAM-dependent methyltransferase